LIVKTDRRYALAIGTHIQFDNRLRVAGQRGLGRRFGPK
jgi:hypothetical protein